MQRDPRSMSDEELVTEVLIHRPSEVEWIKSLALEVAQRLDAHIEANRITHEEVDDGADT